MNGVSRIALAFMAGLFVAAMICMFVEPAQGAECLPLDVTKIRDGDTIEGSGLVIRLAGIDAPETWPGQFQCERERMLGLLAKQRASQLIFSASDRLYCPVGVDRYQRTLGRVLLDGRALGDTLIVEGLAREWTGRKAEWCDE